MHVLETSCLRWRHTHASHYVFADTTGLTKSAAENNKYLLMALLIVNIGVFSLCEVATLQAASHTALAKDKESSSSLLQINERTVYGVVWSRPKHLCGLHPQRYCCSSRSVYWLVVDLHAFVELPC